MKWEQFNIFVINMPMLDDRFDEDVSFTDLYFIKDRWFHRYYGYHPVKALDEEAELNGNRYAHTKVEFLSLFSFLSQQNNCSKPLDKVYALYGLFGCHFGYLPDVDYTRDIRALYTDFTRATVQSSNKFWPASSFTGEVNLHQVYRLGSRT
jgi:hypothetical protein